MVKKCLSGRKWSFRCRTTCRFRLADRRKIRCHIAECFRLTPSSLGVSIFGWVLWLPPRAFIDLESDPLLDLVLSITPAKHVLPLVPKDRRGYPAGKATSLTHPLRRRY